MSRYAESTSVTSEASRAEIERTLTRYGASAFMYGWEDGRAVLQFRMHNRGVRLVLSLPDRDDPRFTLTPTRGTRRSADAQEREYEQAVRQRWRALALVVKAKLEAVDSGISEFEHEFLANILMPNNETVGNMVSASIEQAYATNAMPKTLLALPAGATA